VETQPLDYAAKQPLSRRAVMSFVLGMLSSVMQLLVCRLMFMGGARSLRTALFSDDLSLLLALLTIGGLAIAGTASGTTAPDEEPLARWGTAISVVSGMSFSVLVFWIVSTV